MPLHVYKISAYNHQAEDHQFEAICQWLQCRYADSQEECILISNYNIEGVELDALLICGGGVRVLEFKNWGGKIIARENGSWTAGGLIIEGGAGKKSPYDQIRLNKSRTARGLSSLLSLNVRLVSAAVIFFQDAEIDATQLSQTVRKWLVVCDNRHIEQALSFSQGQVLDNDFIKTVPRRLRIEEFAADHAGHTTSPVNEVYAPEAPTDFFGELLNAIRLRPDYRKVYHAMSQTFRKCLTQKTEHIRINFGGDFAKTDYLLKEYRADGKMVKNTNDTRVRLRMRLSLTDSELERYCLHDLKNLSLFISFIYHADLPQQLVALFPTEKPPTFRSTLVGECMRVIVEQWDDTFVYVHTDDATDGQLTRVCYAKGNQFYDYDWTYLEDLFYKDAQLNLVRPREDHGIIYPELIIFEPDYLVNTTTVAHCFTHYAESPFVELIKKLEPKSITPATVLGNFAGQLLDEAIHQLPDTHTYRDSITTFFKDNAVSLLIANPTPQFHADAQQQQKNIHHAIYHTLPSDVQAFNPREGIVEPSFFSEMLGLQGRMDYLQMDYKLLMEQKSGRAAFPSSDNGKPRQTDEHYVQILLYMAVIRYNYHAVYQRIKNEFQAFLLYSKYTESLVDSVFSPEMLFKAIMIRNRLVWTEMLYTQPNGYRILDGLTPEQLNMRKVNDRLWNAYQRPQIAAILDPIQQASPLEKAYYFRFLTFIANEHVMAKLGNKNDDCAGFAATWHQSVEEKRQAGNIYDGLSLLSPDGHTKGRITSVSLQFADTADHDMSNFRVGDIVIFYPYDAGTEPDVRKTMVLRGTIEEIKTDTIQLSLRAAQTDSRLFTAQKGRLWAIEHDFMESSFAPLYKGMQAFLSAPQERRDLLLLQRRPVVDDQVALKGNYDNFNTLSLRVKQARDFFLIIGPPGTGKTSFGMLNTVKEELLEAGSTVLILSYTNRAVDEICSKLVAESIDFIRIGSLLSCAPAYRSMLLSQRAAQCSNLNELHNTLMAARVVVATTTAMNSHIALFQLKPFTLAVVDEASQILEPHLIGLLSAHNDGVPAIRKFVLIGDHKQLPAVVQQNPEVSKVQDALLNDICLTDCRLSLFERLLRRYGNDPAVTYMLTRQGRMHPDIARFPNDAFYGSRLDMVPLPHQLQSLPASVSSTDAIADLLLTHRIAFLDVDLPESSPSDKVNQNEASLIAALVNTIYNIERDRHFDADTTVGVIVPYRNQIAAVRNAVDTYGNPLLHDITIDTVERFQGSQRKYIIYGFTVSHYYQLRFLAGNVFRDKLDNTLVDRKLNVAMTRAEEHLIMVGHAPLLARNVTFRKLIDFMRQSNNFFHLPEK